MWRRVKREARLFLFHGDIKKQAGGICFVRVTNDKGMVIKKFVKK